jgi:hypothetical protein
MLKTKTVGMTVLAAAALLVAPVPTSAAASPVSAVSFAAACGQTVVTQPGGPQTTINLSYTVCTGEKVTLAPTAYAVGRDSTFTWTNYCNSLPAGSAATGFWRIGPGQFPPVDSSGYTLTNCLDRRSLPFFDLPADASLPCDRTVVLQSGGPGTTITVRYRPCANQVTVAPIAHAVGRDSTYVWTTSCGSVAVGRTGTWVIESSDFPPVDSGQYSLTNCLNV